jgi:hypothetical protein
MSQKWDVQSTIGSDDNDEDNKFLKDLENEAHPVDDSGTQSQESILRPNVSLTEVEKIVQERVRQQLDLLLGPNSEAAWIVDKNYVTPPFVLRSFTDSEKLNGFRNFSAWKTMVNLDLKALNLLPFIESQSGESVKVSDGRRVVLDAQTLQYIKASVSKPIANRLQEKFTAYDAYEHLVKTFGSSRFHEYMDLHNRFNRLRFRPGFDPNRFIGDFERMIFQYAEMGTVFPNEYILSVFLQKIDGVNDPTSPYFSFYTTVNTLPTENQTLEFIKERFQRVAEQVPNKKRQVGDNEHSSAPRKISKVEPSASKPVVKEDVKSLASTTKKKSLYTREINVENLKGKCQKPN